MISRPEMLIPQTLKMWRKSHLKIYKLYTSAVQQFSAPCFVVCFLPTDTPQAQSSCQALESLSPAVPGRLL